MTQSFTVVANTALLALTGGYNIRELVFTGTGAGILRAYDAADTTLTQSNPAYSNKTRTVPYTRTVYNHRDVMDNLHDYTYTGASDADNTVAADASFALPERASLAVPAAGQTTSDSAFTVGRGLVLKATVGGTVQVTYESAL